MSFKQPSPALACMGKILTGEVGTITLSNVANKGFMKDARTSVELCVKDGYRNPKSKSRKAIKATRDNVEEFEKEIISTVADAASQILEYVNGKGTSIADVCLATSYRAYNFNEESAKALIDICTAKEIIGLVLDNGVDTFTYVNKKGENVEQNFADFANDVHKILLVCKPAHTKECIEIACKLNAIFSSFNTDLFKFIVKDGAVVKKYQSLIEIDTDGKLSVKDEVYKLKMMIELLSKIEGSSIGAGEIGKNKQEYVAILDKGQATTIQSMEARTIESAEDLYGTLKDAAGNKTKVNLHKGEVKFCDGENTIVLGKDIDLTAIYVSAKDENQDKILYFKVVDGVVFTPVKAPVVEKGLIKRLIDVYGVVTELETPMTEFDFYNEYQVYIYGIATFSGYRAGANGYNTVPYYKADINGLFDLINEMTNGEFENIFSDAPGGKYKVASAKKVKTVVSRLAQLASGTYRKKCKTVFLELLTKIQPTAENCYSNEGNGKYKKIGTTIDGLFFVLIDYLIDNFNMFIQLGLCRPGTIKGMIRACKEAMGYVLCEHIKNHGAVEGIKRYTDDEGKVYKKIKVKMHNADEVFSALHDVQVMYDGNCEKIPSDIMDKSKIDIEVLAEKLGGNNYFGVSKQVVSKQEYYMASLPADKLVEFKSKIKDESIDALKRQFENFSDDGNLTAALMQQLDKDFDANTKIAYNSEKIGKLKSLLESGKFVGETVNGRFMPVVHFAGKDITTMHLSSDVVEKYPVVPVSNDIYALLSDLLKVTGNVSISNRFPAPFLYGLLKSYNVSVEEVKKNIMSISIANIQSEYGCSKETAIKLQKGALDYYNINGVAFIPSHNQVLQILANADYDSDEGYFQLSKTLTLLFIEMSDNTSFNYQTDEKYKKDIDDVEYVYYGNADNVVSNSNNLDEINNFIFRCLKSQAASDDANIGLINNGVEETIHISSVILEILNDHAQVMTAEELKNFEGRVDRLFRYLSQLFIDGTNGKPDESGIEIDWSEPYQPVFAVQDGMKGDELYKYKEIVATPDQYRKVVSILKVLKATYTKKYDITCKQREKSIKFTEYKKLKEDLVQAKTQEVKETIENKIVEKRKEIDAITKQIEDIIKVCADELKNELANDKDKLRNILQFVLDVACAESIEMLRVVDQVKTGSKREKEYIKVPSLPGRNNSLTIVDDIHSDYAYKPVVQQKENGYMTTSNELMKDIITEFLESKEDEFAVKEVSYDSTTLNDGIKELKAILDAGKVNPELMHSFESLIAALDLSETVFGTVQSSIRKHNEKLGFSHTKKTMNQTYTKEALRSLVFSQLEAMSITDKQKQMRIIYAIMVGGVVNVQLVKDSDGKDSSIINVKKEPRAKYFKNSFYTLFEYNTLYLLNNKKSANGVPVITISNSRVDACNLQAGETIQIVDGIYNELKVVPMKYTGEAVVMVDINTGKNGEIEYISNLAIEVDKLNNKEKEIKNYYISLSSIDGETEEIRKSKRMTKMATMDAVVKRSQLSTIFSYLVKSSAVIDNSKEKGGYMKNVKTIQNFACKNKIQKMHKIYSIGNARNNAIATDCYREKFFAPIYSYDNESNEFVEVGERIVVIQTNLK